MSAGILLHKKAFGDGMSKELWMWKYHLWDSSGIVWYENERMIAYYGCVSRYLLIGSQKIKCANITDTMVVPSKRGVFTKHGVFFQIATTFIKRFTGYDKRYAFCYGFPSERHTKLGEKLGLYNEVDELNQLLWECKKDNSWRYKIAKIDSNTLLKKVDNLYITMKKSFFNFILGDRNKKFIEYRYIYHPIFKYKYFGLFGRFSKKLLGVAIAKEADNDTLEIVDIIAHKRYFCDIIKLLKTLQGYKYIFLWCTPSIEKLLPKEYKKSKVCKICVTNYELPFAIDEIKKKFVMMGGESDFR